MFDLFENSISEGSCDTEDWAAENSQFLLY